MNGLDHDHSSHTLDIALAESTALAATSSPRQDVTAARIGRRTLLKALTAGAAALATGSHGALADTLTASRAVRTIRPAAGYPVGVGASTDPYAAALRAITSCGEWSDIAMSGATVVIKPNLVLPQPSTSGATTDPQVVRALVDLSLAAGAAQVLIVEGNPGGSSAANFAACGYNFFTSYDPQGRVQLVDIGPLATTFAPVPNGLTYHNLTLSALTSTPGIVFISAAKLKTHTDAGATLSMKNLFALAAPSSYTIPRHLPRYDLHQRGIDESTVDLNLARPAHFAIIDGIVGMEGNGPLSGTPLAANVVLAGRNAVAVDRAGLLAMQIPQNSVPYLTYAALRGLGPLTTRAISLLGDTLVPVPFTRAHTPPIVWRPQAHPAAFSPSSQQQTVISYTMPSACYTRVEIIADSETAPGVIVVRTLRDWSARPAGAESFMWDGRDDSGAVVQPGAYLARVQAQYGAGETINYATSWVTISS